MNFGHPQHGQQNFDAQAQYNQQFQTINPNQMPLQQPTFNPLLQSQMPPMSTYPSAMGVMPPITNMPGMLQTSYPTGQGPLAGLPVSRGANGLYEAPEPEGPQPHEAKQYIKLSPGEEVKYNEYWTQACDGTDKVGGKEAVAFLGRAEKVSKGQLRRIWDIADHQQQGELAQDEFYIALRLVALAQRGAELSIGGLRNFTGIQLIPKIKPEEKKEHSVAIDSAKKDEFSWIVPQQIVARYDTFFKGLDLQNKGAIDGRQGVTFFGKSGLPRPTLKKIWQLADITRDGMLSLEEFRTAMHLVTNIRNKRLTVTALPDSLDPSGPNWLRIEGETQSQINPPTQTPPLQTMTSPNMPIQPQNLSTEATPPMQAMPAIRAMPPPNATPPVQARSTPNRSIEQTPSPGMIQQPIVAMPPPPMAPLSQATPRQSNDEAEKMREALRKEKLEVERARREMEEMKAEMERLRLEKESLSKEQAAAQIRAAVVRKPPNEMNPISHPVQPVQNIQQSDVLTSATNTQNTGLTNLSNKVQQPSMTMPQQPPQPSHPIQVHNTSFENEKPMVASNLKPVLSSPAKPVTGPQRDKPIDLGLDDDDIWDQPSPKASTMPGPNVSIPTAKIGGANADDDSSSDDDDFWGTSGLGPKPSLGPASGQNATQTNTGTNKGFGGSELDDWMF